MTQYGRHSYEMTVKGVELEFLVPSWVWETPCFGRLLPAVSQQASGGKSHPSTDLFRHTSSFRPTLGLFLVLSLLLVGATFWFLGKTLWYHRVLPQTQSVALSRNRPQKPNVTFGFLEGHWETTGGQVSLLGILAKRWLLQLSFSCTVAIFGLWW